MEYFLGWIVFTLIGGILGYQQGHYYGYQEGIEDFSKKQICANGWHEFDMFSTDREDVVVPSFHAVRVCEQCGYVDSIKYCK